MCLPKRVPVKLKIARFSLNLFYHCFYPDQLQNNKVKKNNNLLFKKAT